MATDNPFERVLDRLREKGWHKGTFGESKGPNCLVGAHREVFWHRWSSDFKPWQELCIKVLREQFPDRITGQMAEIPNFNDHPDTTFDDVERVLEKAAVKWEEEKVLRDD